MTPRNIADHKTSSSLPQPDEDIGRRVLEAIGSLRYGSVEVTVHDGRIVQIDRRERVRIGNIVRQRD